MSKSQKRKDLVTLAEWCENMSRHNIKLAGDSARSKQNVRSLRFRAKRLAQIATVLREHEAGRNGREERT